MCILASCHAASADTAHSLEMMTSPYPIDYDGNLVSRFHEYFGFFDKS
jgi:hypothetical protein